MSEFTNIPLRLKLILAFGFVLMIIAIIVFAVINKLEMQSSDQERMHEYRENFLMGNDSGKADSKTIIVQVKDHTDYSF